MQVWALPQAFLHVFECAEVVKASMCVPCYRQMEEGQISGDWVKAFGVIASCVFVHIDDLGSLLWQYEDASMVWKWSSSEVKKVSSLTVEWFVESYGIRRAKEAGVLLSSRPVCLKTICQKLVPDKVLMCFGRVPFSKVFCVLGVRKYLYQLVGGLPGGRILWCDKGL